MKAWLFAGAAMLLAAGALAPVAYADGPRASSENHWPGMSDPTANQLAASPDAAVSVAAGPRLRLPPLGEARHRRRRTGGAPGAAFFVGVAHEAERREPFETLVVRRFQPADRLFLAVGEVDAGARDHVLAELGRPVVAV